MRAAFDNKSRERLFTTEFVYGLLDVPERQEVSWTNCKAKAAKCAL